MEGEGVRGASRKGARESGVNTLVLVAESEPPFALLHHLLYDQAAGFIAMSVRLRGWDSVSPRPLP